MTHKARLLLVIDMPELARAIAGRLSGPQCEPVIAENLDQAHAAWSEQTFDVALIDFPMPENETKAIALLCWTRGARVIVTTGFPKAMGELATFLAFIGADILEKPFRLVDVVERLGLSSEKAAA